MRPLPFFTSLGTPQMPSRFVRDLQRERPSFSAHHILKITREHLAKCLDDLQALNDEARVKQLEFSWARHLYEDGSLHFALSAAIDCAVADAEGEEGDSPVARTKKEESGESEMHGSETSTEKRSVGMGNANANESSPLSSIITSPSSLGKSDGEREGSPCEGYRTRHRTPLANVERVRDGDCNEICPGDKTLKRPCPSPLSPITMKKCEARPFLGSMMDRYFPDRHSQQQSEHLDSAQDRLAREEWLSERELARKKLLYQKVADDLGRKQAELKAERERFLADDTRVKEDAWKAARERVRWCEWDIVTLEFDVGLLLLKFTRCFNFLVLHIREEAKEEGRR